MDALFEWLTSAEYGLAIGKIMISLLIGGIIGYEREAHGQAAGLRTNVLVCLSGCLLMLLSLHLPRMYGHLTDESVLRLDPGRIASYAVAGMGFLGAGAIIKGRGSVRGLTTAAALWLVTALGLSVGAGLIIPALVVTALSLPIMYLLRFFKTGINRDTHTTLTIRCCCQDRPLPHIRRVLEAHKELDVESIDFHENRENLEVTYVFRLLGKQDTSWEEIVAQLIKVESLLEVSWTSAEVP
jgi:putative Mg2+ transporter-C (MgtC) family protein